MRGICYWRKRSSRTLGEKSISILRAGSLARLFICHVQPHCPIPHLVIFHRSHMEQSTDRDLITSYRKGDDLALALLIKRHLTPIIAVFVPFHSGCADRRRSHANIFFKAWKHLGRYDVAKPFKTWLFAIAKIEPSIIFAKISLHHPLHGRMTRRIHMAENIPDARPLASGYSTKKSRTMLCKRHHTNITKIPSRIACATRPKK